MLDRRTSFAALILGLAVVTATAARAADTGTGVLTYHNDPARSGLYVAPNLNWDRAAGTHPDPDFNASFTGNVYAQPLYWLPPGAKNGIIIVATESNTVVALDAKTGAEVWSRNLGAETPKSALCAGNIDPVGVTGTPVIDSATATLYLDASIQGDSGPSHKVFALSLETGKIRHGWPVDIAQGLAPLRQAFDSTAQGERGALVFVAGELFVPFGGIDGDCGNYHGMAVGIVPGSAPKVAHLWTTTAAAGGIWGQGGIASDGTSLFFTTGNTRTSSNSPWGGGEAVIRAGNRLAYSRNAAHFYAPNNWQALDSTDIDLGATGPLLLDIPQRGDPLQRILQIGKDGNAYLLDRNRPGGIGGQLAVTQVSSLRVRNAPANFTLGNAAIVVFIGFGATCPGSQSGNVIALRIGANHPTTIATHWCASAPGNGAPIVTTTDGKSDPVVWVLGAGNDGKLHGFRGSDGQPLYSSGALPGLHAFQTLIAAQNRLYVGSDGKVFAFKY